MQASDPHEAGTDTGPSRPARLRSAARGAAPLVAAGVIGAGVAVGIAFAAGLGDESTTVVSEPASAAAAAETEPAAFALEEGSLTIAEIYRRTAPGVVRVTSIATVSNLDPFDPFAPPLEGEQPLGTGSGFVIDTEGHILTNYHVVQGAEEVHVAFSDREPVVAQVVGTDPSTDIALLKVDLPARALTPLPLGSSDEVQVGDDVVAIGNPFGLDRTVTKGIVSALQREILAPNRYEIDEVIQTDAAINPGNSGGPLLNARGEVIGINSQIETGNISSGNVGVGFAVPIDTVREITSQLMETGKVERAYLGVSMQTIDEELTDSFRLPSEEGVLVARVEPGSPADRAGLQGGDDQVIVNGETYVLGGDVITAVDGQPVTTLEELRDEILSHKPGDTIELEVNRDGTPQTITVELGRQPTTPTG
jgi:S1-C subfamily serine protease